MGVGGWKHVGDFSGKMFFFYGFLMDVLRDFDGFFTIFWLYEAWLVMEESMKISEVLRLTSVKEEFK